MLLTQVRRTVEQNSLSKQKNPKPQVPARPPAHPPAPLPSFERLYWLRLGFAAFAGFTADVIGADPSTGISLGILLYLVSYYLVRFSWYRGLAREGQGKVYTTGVGSYILVFLFTWMFLFTVQTVGYPV